MSKQRKINTGDDKTGHVIDLTNTFLDMQYHFRFKTPERRLADLEGRLSILPELKSTTDHNRLALRLFIKRELEHHEPLEDPSEDD